MKKYFISGCALVGLAFGAGSAMAADTAVDTPYDWSGVYIGLQAGGSWANLDQRIPVYPTPIPNGNLSGFDIGPYIGVRTEFGNNLVIGAEFGGNWRNVNGSNLDGNGGERLNTTQNWDASFVGKIGLPIDNLLVYGLGGVAATNVSSQYMNGAVLTPSVNSTVFGWTVGAGLEAGLSEQMTARIEYRFASYGEADVKCPNCGPTFVTPSTHTISAGLSFNF